MALRRISQLDPVLHSTYVSTGPTEPLGVITPPKNLSPLEQLKWIVQNNPSMLGYLMEVSEWNGEKPNAPSYYLSKQFDLSSLITVISSLITGEFDEMSNFTNFQYGEDEKLSCSTNAWLSSYRNTNYCGESMFENDVHFHRAVIIEGDALYPNAELSGSMLSSKESRNDESASRLSVKVPSIFYFPINACAMSSWWADLAEVYDSDDYYQPGTLVQFGGEHEVTIATTEVNAVVTSNPGFILNSSSLSKYAHPIGLALAGRTNVLISGAVEKFDKIILDKDNPGIGCAAKKDDIAGGRTIAVALESNNDPGVKPVMCVTKFDF